MRTVFTNDMLAHVFAQQTQSHGHSNRARFQGDTFYSYAQPVARILTARGKRKVLLVTSRTWSPTTSAHCSDVISACAFDYIRVPSLGHVPYSTSGKPDHAANLAFLTKAHRDNVEKLKRKRALWGSLIDSLGYTADPLNKYCVAFGYKFRLDIDADIAAIEAVRAARDARANTPAAIAKRERDKVRRAYDLAWREAIQDDFNRTNRMDAPARIAAWERGARGGSIWDLPTMLRVKNSGGVETSRGAVVPLTDARRVFGAVARCRAHKASWQRNGERIPVGHFQVDAIDADGNLTAGCHSILWPEIERFARSVGWMDDAQVEA